MNWEEIRKEYETSDITLKALAEKHDIKLGTLKSRKSRDAKDGNEWIKDATLSEKVATKKERKVMIENDELTEQQKLFCLYYINTFNATKSYQKAYKCNYNTANSEGYKLLVNPCIKKEIRRLKAQMQSELFVDATDTTKMFIEAAFADITDFVEFGKKEVPVIGMYGPIKDKETGELLTEEVNFVDLKPSSEVNGQLITEIKQGKDGVSIKLLDKMKSIQELQKRLLSVDELKVEIIKQQLKKLERENSDERSVESKLEELFDKLEGVYRDAE
ncbi:terminase small subunit [Metabacillus fastidiosus]|uniref:Terminase small subunit n=1 Tax=Metabacillus fastidiosus TaxID=1458 RepID=A0ABU6NRK7_9BACI|nr:terminase small subunit [Metabacillus fastidiosus]